MASLRSVTRQLLRKVERGVIRSAQFILPIGGTPWDNNTPWDSGVLWDGSGLTWDGGATWDNGAYWS